ncbi:MAG: glycosyltransferase, partial [Bacteroidetes bacterium]
MPSVAIAILNYNGLSLLQKYLPLVAQHNSQYSICIIDNASTDNSIEWIKKHYPHIHIIQNSHNYGFAKGYNEGLKQIAADYYVLMNNDIRTTENWLSPIINFMEKQPDVAISMPKLLDDTKPEFFEYAGACG